MQKFSNQSIQCDGILMSDIIFDLEYLTQLDYFQEKVAQATNQGRIRIYELIHKKEKIQKRILYEFQAHQGQINSITWQSPKFQCVLATCSKDKTIIIWKEEANQWKIEKKLLNNETYANEIQWAENKFILAVGYNNGQLEVIEGQNYKITNTNAYNQKLQCLDWLKCDNEQVLVTGGQSNDKQIIKLWNVLSDDQTIIDKVYEYNIDETIIFVKFAPQIFDSQMQLAIICIQSIYILTLEYNQQFIKPINLIKQQKIQLDKICQNAIWSILGSKIEIQCNNQIITLEQNDQNDFIRQI